jgi:hypothetical protein
VWQSASVPTVVAVQAPVPGLKDEQPDLRVRRDGRARAVEAGLDDREHPAGGVGLHRLDVQVVVGLLVAAHGRS